MVMLSKMIQYCKRTFSFKRKKVDTIHGLEAGAKLDEEAGKIQVNHFDQVDGEEHTSIPTTLRAKGVPNVEFLLIGDMQEVAPAAVHHPDQTQGELPAAARVSLARDKIFEVLKRISFFAASSAIAAVVVGYLDAVAIAPSTTVTGLLIIMFVDGLLLKLVHIFREEIFPEQARPWQFKLIKFSIVLLFTSTTTCFVLVVAKSNNNNNSNSN